MHRWYHPNLGSNEAERLLLKQGEDGSFVVRPSASCAGHFVLSVRRQDEVFHVRIPQGGNSYYLDGGGGQFATLSDLIQHYTGKSISDKSGAIYQLKRPINSSKPITERWFHGSIGGKEAERLLLEQGVDGSFLVRESQSQVGDYVLNIRTKDESSERPVDRVTQVLIHYSNGKYNIHNSDEGKKFDSLTDLVEYYRGKSLVEKTDKVMNLVHPLNTTRITAIDIDARIEELSRLTSHDEDGFWEEFRNLQQQESQVLLNRKVGREDRNVLKNRFRFVLPYDNNRVILKRSFQSDYINASYIKLVDDDIMPITSKTKPLPHSKVYIATQGPLLDTTCDFWLMVWQERSTCIVMVTGEVERGKNKCCQYWPTLENHMSIMRCGPIEIKLLSEATGGINYDYTCRELEIRYVSDNVTNNCPVARRIVHYQYHSWPDVNIPSDPSHILNFLHHINHRQLSDDPKLRNPMIVHCSSGVGRSGTIIIIDMIIDQLRSKDSDYNALTYEIDIQRLVKMGRSQRCALVQTEAQYRFIYLAIQNYIDSYIQK